VPRIRNLFRLSGPTVAWWAWRHRDEVIDWAHFGVRSARKLLRGDRDDPIVEARVRAALSTDPRTRRADGLRVEVHEGVVHLRGAVTSDVRDVAIAIAQRTNGVKRVEDELDIVGQRRRVLRR
jgi:osmotically-inducible protein OsmY